MKYSILALLLLSGQAHSLTTECDDGYVYKLFGQTAVQAMNEAGKPQICEGRLERRNARNATNAEIDRLRSEAIHKMVNTGVKK